MTSGNLVTAGMVTVREESVSLFDHLSLRHHKHKLALLLTGSVMLLLKIISAVLLEALDLTGSVATELARVGGVCLHFFLHGT